MDEKEKLKMREDEIAAMAMKFCKGEAGRGLRTALRKDGEKARKKTHKATGYGAVGDMGRRSGLYHRGDEFPVRQVV